MDQFRQSVVASLAVAAVGLAPAASLAGGLDLKSLMSDGSKGEPSPRMLDLGTGLSKALPIKANYSIETSALAVLKPVEQAVSRKIPEEAATPDVPAVKVISRDEDSAADNPGTSDAKSKAKAKDTPQRSRRNARRSSSHGASSARGYDVPTNAIISNELMHAAKSTQRLAGEP